MPSIDVIELLNAFISFSNKYIVNSFVSENDNLKNNFLHAAIAFVFKHLLNLNANSIE